VKTRLALSRLAKDERLEGSLFLYLGQRARKSNLYNVAANCFAQAEAAFILPQNDKHFYSDKMSSLQLQVAKLKHDCGESSAALKILSLDDLESFVESDQDRLHAEISRRASAVRGSIAVVDQKTIDMFVRGALQSTLWMIEGGLKSSVQVINRFHVIHKLAPGWEKGKNEP
jgi:hypothetical protein